MEETDLVSLQLHSEQFLYPRKVEVFSDVI